MCREGVGKQGNDEESISSGGRGLVLRMKITSQSGRNGCIIRGLLSSRGWLNSWVVTRHGGPVGARGLLVCRLRGDQQSSSPSVWVIRIRVLVCTNVSMGRIIRVSLMVVCVSMRITHVSIGVDGRSILCQGCALLCLLFLLLDQRAFDSAEILCGCFNNVAWLRAVLESIKHLAHLSFRVDVRT